MEVSVAWAWRDETDRWLLEYRWLPLAVRCLVLAAFGGGALLAIAITTLVTIVFILSMNFPCQCNDDIKYEHGHNSYSRGGGAC